MRKFHYAPPPELPSVLFEDDHLLVVNKPSGLLSNPGIAPETKDCLLSRLEAHYGELYLVHRLDCDTSGILVLARNKAAERHLKIQWQNRQVKKHYLAIVQGHVSPATGVIDKPLAADVDNPPYQKVCYYQGKAAQTEYTVLEQNTQTTRLALAPLTGRTHQLRVHLLSIGHPIINDAFYGVIDEHAANSRLLLHADLLNFQHPDTNLPVEFSSPADF